jgi:hypothetical protein
MVEKNLLTISILEAIEQSAGCPLCYLWLKTQERQLEDLLSDEVVMNPDFRESVVLAKGFCNHHMHLLYKTAQKPGVLDGLGYALYARDIVGSIIGQLERFPLEDLEKREIMASIKLLRWRKGKKHLVAQLFDIVRRAVRGKLPCPACKHLRTFDEIHLHTLLAMLKNDDFRKDFRRSKRGLCIPHFEAAMRTLESSKLTDSAKIAMSVFELEIEHLESIAHYLSEFIRKQSWDARDEPRGSEVNTNKMALEFLVGAAGLCCETT